MRAFWGRMTIPPGVVYKAAVAPNMRDFNVPSRSRASGARFCTKRASHGRTRVEWHGLFFLLAA